MMMDGKPRFLTPLVTEAEWHRLAAAFFAASQVNFSGIEQQFVLLMRVPLKLAVYYAVRYVLSSMDTSSGSSKKSRQKSQSLLAQTNLSEDQLAALDLDEYESTIAGEIIPPSSIDVSFESIGGLDEIIASLRETVIYPLTFPELFGSGGGLLSAPKGVLLYGHPGCGKTMLAKALAKESGATFINLPLSSLWVALRIVTISDSRTKDEQVVRRVK